jgi:hypothetical protein
MDATKRELFPRRLRSLGVPGYNAVIRADWWSLAVLLLNRFG